MSRIMVKNLPKYITQERLREIFSKKGEITDVQLKKKIDGNSRQFAFIGYRTEQEAQEALIYFNRSFIDASRIICEVALQVGDPHIPAPWSRNSLKKEDISATSSADAPLGGSSVLSRKGKKSRKTNENEDLKLQEFLQVMQPRAKTKLWEDDVTETMIGDKEDQNDTKKKAVKNKTVKKKQVSVNSDGIMTNEVCVGQSESKVVETTKNIVHDDAVSDMDYLKSRIKDWSDSEIDNDIEASDGSMEEHPVNEEGSVHMKSNYELQNNDNVDEKHFEDIDGEVPVSEKLKLAKGHEVDVEFEKDRLYVENVPYTATEDELEEFFSEIGNVSQVHIVRDKHTKRSKGYGFIRYSAPEYASRALKELANSVFQGRCLRVLPAEKKSSPDIEGTNLNLVKNFKEKREEKRKASEDSGNTKAWNPFFIRQDTAVEYNAGKYSVSKSDLLDPESDDIAVRIAIGETQAIADTKKALQSAGINVAALEELASDKNKVVKRSNHMIFVKNLPSGSTEGELAKMFRKFGSLDKIIMPSTKTMALIIYLEPSEASAALNGLRYRRFREVPLYLEMAPANLLDGTVKSNDGDSNSTAVGERDAKKQLVEDETLLLDIDPDRVESRSIHVKNLNFKTTEESLREHFAGYLKEGKICSVKIIKHKKDGKILSKGYGFIEFDSVDTATRACKDLQATVLDAHELKLDLCHAKDDEKTSGKTGKGKSLTKIIVRNVAFEATEKDLRLLFSTYGQIKSIRLPKKFENHKGYAFIEFTTKQDVERAMQALSSTHLYGRRLVIERAKEEESLEELRQRTASQYSNEQDGLQSKLSKKRKHTDMGDEGNMEFD